MEYAEAIDKGFELYDKIENEICIFARTDDCYTSVKYSDGVLFVEADCINKDIEAKIQIKREEIVSKVLEENLEPKDAICELLRKKICIAAQEIKR